MTVGVPKETAQGERRVALVPDVVKRLAAKGLEIRVEPGAGEQALIPDSHYEEAGATLSSDVWSADVVVKVNPPTEEEIGKVGNGSVLVGFLAPRTQPETIEKLRLIGSAPLSSTPEGFKERVAYDIKRWTKLTADVGIPKR